MTFEDWMTHRGLSASSVKKYASALSGPMSEWAMEHDLVAGPLTSINSPQTFQLLSERIRELEIFKERNLQGHSMYGAALNQYLKYLSEGFNNSVEDDIDAIFGSTIVGETEKAGLIKTRIGQGAFRAKLIDLWGSCAVTGYQDLNLLVASHIKPWSVSSNSERLDVYNGLLLIPNLDKAFDSGFISFKESGEIMIAPLLDAPEQLDISSDMRIQLRAQHLPYLEFHRSNVFRDE